MRKTTMHQKFTALILTLTMICTVFCVGIIHASAASYPSVTLNVPRISQRPNTGDCAIASVATIEAFMYGYPSGDYNSEIYTAVYEANDYSISANWSELGYYAINDFDMETVYEQLSSGYPVIAYRTSSHYSVIYAYVGSTDKLELSGFMIEDVDDSYNDTNAKKTLDNWVGKYNLTRMVVRRDGLPIPQSKITITCNHPSKYHLKGASFSVCGNIVSSYNIKSVTMSIVNSKNKVANSSTFSATPNSRSFNISDSDSVMYFSKLTVGDYTYKITAKDSSGATANYSFSFSVVSDNSSIPDTPTIYTTSSTTSQTTKVTSYKAVVNANPALNLRAGAGETYSILASIPNGTTITITTVTDTWGKTNYNGQTGWVKLSFLTEQTTKSTTAKTTATTKNVTSATTKSTTKTTKSSLSFVQYIKTKAQTSLRASNSSFSSNLLFIPKNTILKVIDSSGWWFKVKYNNKTGWVLYPMCTLNIGDTDSDDKISSSDALLVLKYATGSATLTQSQLTISDIDGNNTVNSSDALEILKIVIGNYD